MVRVAGRGSLPQSARENSAVRMPVKVGLSMVDSLRLRKRCAIKEAEIGPEISHFRPHPGTAEEPLMTPPDQKKI